MKTGNKKAHFSTMLAGSKEKKASDVNDRIGRYANAHRRALIQTNYIHYHVIPQSIGNEKNKYQKLENNLRKCGHWLVFRDYYTINENRLISADFCKKHLLCPLCAIRRGAKYLQAYLPKYEQVTRDNPKLKAYMITLTVVNGDDLLERVQHLQKAYRKMLMNGRRFREGKRGYKYTESSKALGGVFSTEVKRGENSGLWHPHLHMVWLCEEEPNLERLAKEWKEYTGDSHVVDITPFYGDPVESFCEVFKYALKFSDMECEDTWFAFKTLTGKRLIDCFGVLKGVEVDEDLLESPIDEDLPYIDKFFMYLSGGEYSLVKAVDHEGTQLHTTDVEFGRI